MGGPIVLNGDTCSWKGQLEKTRCWKVLRVSGSIGSMSPKTDFTMEIPYFDYWDSRGVNRFSLGPTVWELPYGHENTVIRKKTVSEG